MSTEVLEISGNLDPSRPIDHDGPVLIRGNVENGCLVIAAGDINIDGDVSSSKIKSHRGSVTINGSVKGATTQIHAGKDIRAKLVYNSSLKAGNDITIHDIAIDAHIVARNCVLLDGKDSAIEGGEVEAGRDIIASTIGDFRKSPTIVRLTNFRQEELYNTLIQHEREEKEIAREISELDKFIEVIRLLGKKVVVLPPEKKQELALKVKRFNELKGRLADLEKSKQDICAENSRRDELERAIIVRKDIYEGVNVAIDKTRLLVQSNYKRVILYKKGIIIIGDFDEFMKRKKYY